MRKIKEIQSVTPRGHRIKRGRSERSRPRRENERLRKKIDEQAALCVLVKSKEPKIEWHVASRLGENLADFLAKAEYIGREIAAGRFYKRSGKWCSWCDYVPCA